MSLLFSSLFSFTDRFSNFSPSPDCLLLYLIFIFALLHSVLSQYDSHSIFCLTLFLSISIKIKRLSKRLSIHILIEEFTRENMNPFIAADCRPQLDAAAADKVRIQANIEVSIMCCCSLNILYRVFAIERFPFYLTSPYTVPYLTLRYFISPHRTLFNIAS